MIAIWKHEFLQMFKSVKSILVLLFLIGSTYAGLWIVDQLFAGNFPMPIGEEKSLYTLGLSTAIVIFGPLFAFALSHDVFNREISQRMMRFLVTKTKRINIVLGKFLGAFAFWVTILVASYGLIFIDSGSVSFKTFFESLSIISVLIGIAMILSLLVPKPMLSMFLAVLLGIVYPAVSFWSIYSEKWYIIWFRYITPYYYTNEGDSMLFLVNYGLAVVLVLLSIVLFRRRDV